MSRRQGRRHDVASADGPRHYLSLQGRPAPYYSVPSVASARFNAVWTYEEPYAAVPRSRTRRVRIPDSVEAIEEQPGGFRRSKRKPAGIGRSALNQPRAAEDPEIREPQAAPRDHQLRP